MKKDFTEWFRKKVEIENDANAPMFHAREIWWCFMGKNIGVEIDGKGPLSLRPVFIWRKFNKNIAQVLPSTSNDMLANYYFHFVLDDESFCLVLSQLGKVSVKRLFKRIGIVSWEQYSEIDTAMLNFLKLKDPRRDLMSDPSQDPWSPFGKNESNISDP